MNNKKKADMAMSAPVTISFTLRGNAAKAMRFFSSNDGVTPTEFALRATKGSIVASAEAAEINEQWLSENEEGEVVS